mgnify:CR=1 FL=1
MENQQVGSSPKDGSVTSPRDVFLNLLAIAALYFNVVSFGALLFQFVNQWLPDPLVYDSFPSIASSVRFSIATLVIVLPLYLFISWLLEREYHFTPAKRDVRVRKWLIYLTLFIAAIVIVGDLVTLVYSFLEGELTMRFVLKIVILFALAGVVFLYYIGDLRGVWSSRARRIFAWSVSGVVLAGIVVGFLTAGSPFYARELRFDERRVNDLQTLQSEIINFWTHRDVLPNAFDNLKDDISGFNPPVDPVTGAPYEYRVTAPLKFELCAIFTTSILLPVGKSRPLYAYEDTWEHGAERVCFNRTIDPARYGTPAYPKRIE